MQQAEKMKGERVLLVPSPDQFLLDPASLSFFLGFFSPSVRYIQLISPQVDPKSRFFQRKVLNIPGPLSPAVIAYLSRGKIGDTTSSTIGMKILGL